MTTFDYAGLRDNTAEPLLARFGKSATLVQPGTPSGPEWDPTPGESTESTVTVVETRFNIEDREGSLVQVGDRMFLVSTAGGAVPALADKLTIDSATYQIINVKPLKPGSVTMLYRLHVRK
jgi:hypothetical protein